ncbi:hypothetical protein OENI_50148 [Oenococcus oeni]|nr:hypothetical protein OENI_50148 [Oenococcus oeni]SYW03598.1 hypothetical protein OENI_420003 [Oenococcus oeni]SYW19189.1 hypothetical protein OENI_70149 [Oenococcus oeni]
MFFQLKRQKKHNIMSKSHIVEAGYWLHLKGSFYLAYKINIKIIYFGKIFLNTLFLAVNLFGSK